MANSTTLDCRLLCASNVADEIKNRGLLPPTFQPDPCYYNPVGFTSPPTIISGGAERIDACLVGTSNDGVILSFRGTLLPSKDLASILDWLQDFLAFPVAVKNLPGKVHLGFYNSVRSVWNKIVPEIKRQMDASGKPLIITGHSKGASMATLASMMLHEDEGITAETVTTFACPNTGDVDFATGYKAIFQQTTYLNHLDIIPFLPPAPFLAKELAKIPKIGFLFKWFETLNYHSASDHGIYITSKGTTISQAKDGGLYSLAVLQDLIDIQKMAKTQDGIGTILKAHMPGCGGGYMKGGCGNTVCGSSECRQK